jgi:N6-L-threonylcarbamoyladenine synthase
VTGLCLGIETSCDETAAAVLEGAAAIRSSVVSSQYVHSLYGGVVPELAARAHARLIVPVVQAALDSAGATLGDIGLIAVTHTPGLMGALLVGLPFAKTLAWASRIPFIGVNHLEGHIFALRLERPDLAPPFLACIVSGGHTELLVVEDWCRYRLLGATIDDACGEAFDKVAKLLGLPYPGGPLLESLAREGRAVIPFPRPEAGNLDFSYSGLKTAVLYFLRDHRDADKADVAASFQRAALGLVVRRIARAAEVTGLRTVGVSGGVAANDWLRDELTTLTASDGIELVIPRLTWCTDNAAMIAAAGAERFTRFGPSPFDLPAAARTRLS